MKIILKYSNSYVKQNKKSPKYAIQALPCYHKKYPKRGIEGILEEEFVALRWPGCIWAVAARYISALAQDTIPRLDNVTDDHCHSRLHSQIYGMFCSKKDPFPRKTNLWKMTPLLRTCQNPLVVSAEWQRRLVTLSKHGFRVRCWKKSLTYPHWSYELMSQMQPWVNILCS